MTRYLVRFLCSSDCGALCQLEAEGSGDAVTALLGPHDLRLCTGFSGGTGFLALVDGRPAGYLLYFVRDRETDCTTPAVRTEFQRTRVTPLRFASLVRTIIDAVDPCWSTVKPDNAAARSLHTMREATVVGQVRDLHGLGAERIVSKLDRSSLESLHPKDVRLGLIPRQAVAA
ncbi:MAG: hypothetical protein WKG01_05010 [Kofleriaceae bacterium]